MDLLEKASIILTPTASNNGEALCVKPSDGSGDFDFSRNSAATRVNAQGLVENVQIQSSNLVQNGDFSEEGAEEVSNGGFSNGSTDWTLGTGWSIGEDKAVCDGTQTSLSFLIQNGQVQSGKTYKVTYDVTSYTSGEIIAFIGGSQGQTITSVGTYTEYLTTSNTNFWLRANADFIGSITNISVKEVGQNWTLETGWSIGENKAISDGSGSIPNTDLVQSNVFTTGKSYKVTLEIKDYVSGNLQLQNNTTNFPQSNGIHTIYSSTGSTSLILRSLSFIGSITNISVIEITTDTSLPRINYEGFSYDGSGNVVPDSGCGSWLFEPQSTNLITYSEDFSQWTLGSNSTLTFESDVVAPDGSLGVYKLTLPAISDTYILYPSFANSNPLAVSIYAKSTENGNDDFEFFTGGTNISDIKTATSEWKRFDYIANGSSLAIINSNDAYETDIYIWGAQAENLTYSTSYIPTNGEANGVTRNQDLCTNGGSLASINSTEGTLYFEGAALTQLGGTRHISVSSGSDNNRLYFYYQR